MSKKEIKARVKLNLPAGKATPAPPVGPSVSPTGVNIKQFCDDFNNRTKGKEGFVIPIELVVYKDKTYDLTLKQPTISNLIKRAASVEKGASDATGKAGTITKAKLEEISLMKMPDLNTISKEQAMKIVSGSARSMGIEVEDE